MQHVVGALLRGDAEAGLHDSSQVAIGPPQLGRHVVASEDLGEEIGATRSPRRLLTCARDVCSAPDLEKADDVVPMDERREEDLGEIACGQKRAAIQAGASDVPAEQ